MITSRMLQWTPNGTVITLLVPGDRGAEPARNPIPASPLIRRTRDEPTPTRTLPFLLKDEHDKSLFVHYTRSQVAELTRGRRPRLIGEPAMYESISLSPDGQYLLTQQVVEPFSFITSYQGFAGRTEVMDLEGNVLAVLDEQELREKARSGRDDDRDDAAPRELSWRPDGVGVSFLQRGPGESDSASEEDESRGDRIMLLAPPFAMDQAQVIARSEDPLEDLQYSPDGAYVFATVSHDDEDALAAFDLSSAEPARHLIVDFYDPEDVTQLPGELFARQTSNGISYAVVSTDGGAVYLHGDGLKDDFKPQPFIDQPHDREPGIADGLPGQLFVDGERCDGAPHPKLEPVSGDRSNAAGRSSSPAVTD
jgi:hypothetical protein